MKNELLITFNTDTNEGRDLSEQYGKAIVVFKEDLKCEICGKSDSYAIKESNQQAGICKECMESPRTKWILDVEKN